MFCYQDTCFNTKGDALSGYYVECLSDGVVQSIFADIDGSTPIISSSGVANRAKTDARGNFFFYVEGGTYTLKYYDSNGVYQFSSPEFSVSEQVVSTAETSAGVDDAGKVPILDATDGRIDRTLLAPDGYQRQKVIILSDTGNVGNLGNWSGSGLDSFFQIHGTSQTSTGIQVIVWGNHAKGVQNYFGKSRGSTYDAFSSTAAGDRVKVDYIQAAGVGASFGHVGTETWTVDATPTNTGELAGRWAVTTGTGNHNTENPTYYGLRTAILANKFQQIYFPGQLTAVADIPAAAADFGAHVRIGIGGTGAGQAAIRFDLTSAALMTTAVAGCYEVDSSGIHYITDVNAKRDAVLVGQVKVSGDSGAVAVGAAAGTGATIDSLVWGHGCVRITMTSGTGTTTGTIFTITYPHPFSNYSFAWEKAGNAVGGAYWGRNTYRTCSTTEVVYSTNATALTASTQYIVDVFFIGY